MKLTSKRRILERKKKNGEELENAPSLSTKGQARATSKLISGFVGKLLQRGQTVDWRQIQSQRQRESKLYRAVG
jgi:hypothetical protein